MPAGRVIKIGSATVGCFFARQLRWNSKYLRCSSTQATFGNFSTSESVLYVHWPFCSWLCTFCNFNKYVRNNVDQRRMRDCLVKETKTLLDLSGAKNIRSVYFGGGTPSLTEPKTIAAVLDAVSEKCCLPRNAEITLEANPTPEERQKLRSFKDVGINRLSLGVQSLKDEDLLVLGRGHTVEDSIRTLEAAKEIFPGHMTIDLIFGRPGQRLDSWRDELVKALKLCDNHVSLYQLTVERGTPLHKSVSAGKLNVPGVDIVAELYELAIEMLENSGLMRYEAANFSRPGFESQHNLAYWQGVQYIGVGPGAHGRFVSRTSGGLREARVQTLEPNNWMTEVELHGHGTRKQVKQTNLTVMKEVLMLGLRTTLGISNVTWMMFSGGVSLEDVFSSPVIQAFIEDGLLALDEKGLRATRTGLNVIDSILPELILHLEDAAKEKFGI